LKQVVVAMWQQ